MGVKQSSQSSAYDQLVTACVNKQPNVALAILETYIYEQGLNEDNAILLSSKFPEISTGLTQRRKAFEMTDEHDVLLPAPIEQTTIDENLFGHQTERLTIDESYVCKKCIKWQKRQFMPTPLSWVVYQIKYDATWANVAFALISTRQSNPECTIKSCDSCNAISPTALRHVCGYLKDPKLYPTDDMEKIAIALLRTNTYNLKQKTDALTCACENGNTTIALAILRTIDECINNTDKDYALWHACDNKMTDVAMELITKHNAYCDKMVPRPFPCTPLIMACIHRMSEVALALIYTGKSNIKYYNPIKPDTATALIWACKNDWGEIALAMLDSKEPCSYAVADEDGYTALVYACKSTNPVMVEVAKRLILLTKYGYGYYFAHKNKSTELCELFLDGDEQLTNEQLAQLDVTIAT